MSFGKCGGERNQPFVPRRRIGIVKAAGRWRGVDEEIGVMDDRTVRPKFEAANIPHVLRRKRDDKIAERVGSIGGQRVLGQLDDQIGRPELPA